MNSEKRLIFSGVLFIAMAYGISRFSYGLLLPYFKEPFGLNERVSGIISALGYLMYSFGLISIFTLFKNIQPRTALVISGILSILGLLILTCAMHAWMFATGVAITGFAAGVATAPFGNIVKEEVKYGRQDKSNGWINTGIGFGLIITGCIALIFTDRWRFTYLTLSIISGLILYWNYKKLPKVDLEQMNPHIDIRHLVSGKLMIATLLLGVGTSAYWTYFQDYIFQTDYGEWSKFFWITLGIGGVMGGLSGNGVQMLGVKKVQIITGIVLGISNILLGITNAFPLVILSTVLFGIVYVFANGVYAFWCARLYVTHPATGVVVTFICLTIGQFVGTFIAGFMLYNVGFEMMFIIYGIFSLSTILFRPMDDELEDI